MFLPFAGIFGVLHKKGVLILNTFDKIDMLLKQQKKKQIQLTNYLGLNKNAYSDWKIGRTSSYTKHLSQIAEFFDVSVDYLLGKEKKPSAPEGTESMGENEKRLFAIWETIPEEQKPELLNLIETALRIQQNNSDK